MKILGISAYYHDSAAAMIFDGKIVAAVQEERFNRQKHFSGFPTQGIKYCLEQGGCRLSEIDGIAFYDKPLLKFDRLLETYLAFGPRGFRSFRKSMPTWLNEKLFLKRQLLKSLRQIDENYDGSNLLFSEHHMSHAASAFYPSPFRQAVALTIDGVGEWATCSAAIGDGSSLEIFKEINFPHSLGLLYSAFTYYAGFKVNSGEYKLMGLAPYGKPVYCYTILDNLIDVKPDGSFRLNLDYFDYCTGLKMTNDLFDDLFGMPPRKAETEISSFYMNIASSVQAALEHVLLKMITGLHKETRSKNLVMAGGVALNCVANGKITKSTPIEAVWVQPAAGDAGGALGAAYAAYYQHFGNSREEYSDRMQGAMLGPNYSVTEIEGVLQNHGASYSLVPDETLFEEVASALSDGMSVGWFQGRMEYGPRALGNRSILADPRNPDMQKELNLKIKFRESFRPFAPAILAEDREEWFELDHDSPYMLFVGKVAGQKLIEQECDEKYEGLDRLKLKRSEVPATTHVDSSSRVQTVSKETNHRFHKLLSAFKDRTGCPILVNTSFNVRGEPIVCTPKDALACFLNTGLDVLVLENYIVYKNRQCSVNKPISKTDFVMD